VPHHEEVHIIYLPVGSSILAPGAELSPDSILGLVHISLAREYLVAVIDHLKRRNGINGKMIRVDAVQRADHFIIIRIVMEVVDEESGRRSSWLQGNRVKRILACVCNRVCHGYGMLHAPVAVVFAHGHGAAHTVLVPYRACTLR